MNVNARILSLMLALVAARGAGASHLEAQGPRFSVGGGLTVPAGGYGTADGAGWHVLGAALAPLSAPLGLRVDAMYGRTPRQGLETGHTWLWGGTASIVWRLPRADPTLCPYLLTGLGIYDVGVVRAVHVPNRRGLVRWGRPVAPGGGAGARVRGGPVHHNPHERRRDEPLSHQRRIRPAVRFRSRVMAEPLSQRRRTLGPRVFPDGPGWRFLIL
jgi:hypothetical protein